MVNKKFFSSLSGKNLYNFLVVVRYDNNLPFWRFTVSLYGNEVSPYFVHLIDAYPSNYKIRVYLVPSYQTIIRL